MDTIINNLITTTYSGTKGILTSKKWDDGKMRHHTIDFMGEQNGTFVRYSWTDITIFTHNNDLLYFEGRRNDGLLDSKTVHGVKFVETE